MSICNSLMPDGIAVTLQSYSFSNQTCMPALDPCMPIRNENQEVNSPHHQVFSHNSFIDYSLCVLSVDYLHYMPLFSLQKM